jgi:hypothetical protein
MAAYESLMEANLHRDYQWRVGSSLHEDARSCFKCFCCFDFHLAFFCSRAVHSSIVLISCRSESGSRKIIYTEMTHIELRSGEGDPYFKFPEWKHGSLVFKEHHDQTSEKKISHSHMLTQFPSTVRSSRYLPLRALTPLPPLYRRRQSPVTI